MPRICERSFRLHQSTARPAMVLLAACAWLLCTAGGVRVARAADDAIKPDPASVEFFEKKVRPILSARCHGATAPDKQKGGLRLDARATVLAGGSTGPAVVPGNPGESLLVDAINYGETYQMPPKSKLPAEEIATLTEWVQRGAPWGVERRAPPAASPAPPGSRRALEGGIPGACSLLELSASPQPLASRGQLRAWPLRSQPHRPLHPSRTRTKEFESRAGSRQAHPDSPPHIRPDRASPQAR